MQHSKLSALNVNTKANIASLITWLAIVGPLVGSVVLHSPSALAVGSSAFWMLLSLQAFGLAATSASLSGIKSDDADRFTRSFNALALTLSRLEQRTPLSLALGWVLSGLLLAIGVYCSLLTCAALYASGMMVGRLQQAVIRSRLNGLGSTSRLVV
jgi:hypothetical protein